MSKAPPLLRIQLYGPTQSRKTWWAGTLAEAGYNVLFIASDPNLTILKHLSPEAQRRIYVVNVQDTPTQAVAVDFWTLLLRNQYVWYSEESKSCYLVENGGHQLIDIRKWDANYCIVNDSYTATVQSVQLRYANENNIDLADAAKPEWDGYGFCGRWLSWALQAMNKVPCHFINIAHSTQYEKRKDKADSRGRIKQVVEWTRRQPVSSSGPHGMQVGKEWGENYYLYQHGGSAFIEPYGDEWSDGGSRFLPRQKLNWEEWPAWRVFKEGGFTSPNERGEALPYIEFPVSDKPTLQDALASRQRPVPLPGGQATAAAIQPGLAKQ